MRKSFSTTILATLALVLVGCGGGGDDAFETPGSGGGGGGTNPSVASITLTTSAPSIPSDGSGSATITALVRDANNNLIPNISVTFTATSGGVAGSPATTDANGSAVVTLSTAGDPTLRTITVTGTASGMSDDVDVQVVAGGGSATTVQMGSGTGANFQAGIIGIQNSTLSAGGSTSLQVVLQQTDGTLYTQSAAITFSSACAAQGLANITGPITTSTGIASATYSATGCSGDDVINATATVEGTALSASGTVTVAASAIGSIVFESATPTNIALKGTGDSGRPESSTVVFRVLDATGGPRANADVTFALNSSVGGLMLGPATAQSGTDGRVQTVVTAGTVATSVRVTATVTSITPNISTQSSQLTVTTGIPDQNSFSLAVQCQNVEALDINGITVPVTARLADRFNNPVANGTAVTFTTEGGSIQPQCTTTTTSTEAGVCTVNWTSSNPRPTSAGGGDRAGRASLLATAIGEESFTDANGNGTFDNGENFTDVAERFLDEDEDDVFDIGEPIYDFNNNSTRDPADGDFNGVLCLDTSGRCNANAQTTGIGASNLIIMSGGTPDGIIEPAVPLHVPANGSASFSFTFADRNDNPMPSGTTITAAIAGSNIALGDPKSFTVPCTTEPTTYSFTITSSAATGSGNLTLTVKSPSGLETVLQYPVAVP